MKYVSEPHPLVKFIQPRTFYPVILSVIFSETRLEATVFITKLNLKDANLMQVGHACAHLCVHMRAYTCVCVCMRACVRVYLCACVYACVRVYMCACVYVCVCVRACMCVRVCV